AGPTPFRSELHQDRQLGPQDFQLEILLSYRGDRHRPYLYPQVGLARAETSRGPPLLRKARTGPRWWPARARWPPEHRLPTLDPRASSPTSDQEPRGRASRAPPRAPPRPRPQRPW